MKRILLLLAFIFLSFNFLFSQITSFNFNTAPFIKANAVNENLDTAIFLLSNGTLSTNVTTGTYFTDEPFVEESGGWSEIDSLLAKHFYIELNAKQGFQFSLDSIKVDYYVTGSGPSAVSLIINDSVFATNNSESNTLYQQKYETNTLTKTSMRIKLAGWDNGSRTTSGGGAFRVDNFQIYGSVNETPPNDTNSSITTSNFGIANSLPSIYDTVQGIKIMEIIVSDSASTDAFFTQIDSLLFTANNLNTISNFTDVIKKSQLIKSSSNDTILGEIKDTCLFFNSLEKIQVGNGKSDSLDLFIWLKTDLNGFDNHQLGLNLTAPNVFCNSLGSQIDFSSVSSGTNDLFIRVDATKLDVKLSDNQIFADSVFEITITTIDENNNLDIDQTGQVNINYLSEQCTLNPTQPLSGNFSNGVFHNSELSFSGSDTVKFSINANDFNTVQFEKYVGKNFFTDNFSQGLSKWENTADWETISSTDTFSLHHSLLDTEGTSYISSAYKHFNMKEGKMVWNITLRNGDFDPTSSNRFWYYIMASSSNLIANSLFGYAVGVNFSGSTDTLSLWKIDSLGNKSLIVKSNFDWNSNTQQTIEVIRTSYGFWQLGHKNDSMSDFNYTNQVADTEFNNLSHHGLVFQYTSSRAGELWMNNISTYQLNTPPIIEIAEGYSDSIVVQFTENLQNSNISDLNNYNLYSETDYNVQLLGAYINPNNSSQVILKVNSLKTASYSLQISGLNDTELSTMQTQTVSFSYEVPALWGNLVINEILFDPTPSVALPEGDFLEIYNRSAEPINLNNWKLQIGTSTQTFPDTIIYSHEYVTVTSSALASEFANFGKTIGILSSSALTNSPKTVNLISPTNVLIDSVHYNPNWITDPDKEDGGWSLERIDYDNLCGASQNWTVSLNEAGGTPCAENSVYSPNIDTQAPKITNANFVSKQIIQVGFSEEVNENSLLQNSNWQLTPSMQIDSLQMFSNSKVNLFLSKEIDYNQTYSLSVKGVLDYCQNQLSDTALNILYHKTQAFDLVFNELMPDCEPSVGLSNSDYIELFNRSNYSLNLKNWELYYGETKKTFPEIILHPNEYLLVVQSGFSSEFSQFGNIVELLSSSSLPISGKSLLIKDSTGLVIDSVFYKKLWYQTPEKEDGGWSLERIDPDNTCSTYGNWIASENYLGGTPCAKNSVDAENKDTKSPKLEQIFPISENKLIVDFSEPPLFFNNISDVFKINETNFPIEVTPDLDIENRFWVSFENNFVDNEQNILKIAFVQDFCGNKMNDTVVSFQYYEASLYNVVINEVMMNPEPSAGLPECEYIELKNVTNKKIYICNWQLSVNNSVRTIDYTTIEPNGYLLLGKENNKVALSEFGNFAKVEKMPALPQSATLRLLDSKQKLICTTSYKSSWITDDFKADGGFSLERIDFNNPNESLSNWGVSFDDLGGTPGKENSIYTENADIKRPNLLRAYIISDSLIALDFSEPMNFENAKVSDFVIRDIAILDLYINQSNLSSIYLKFDAFLEQGKVYEVQANSKLTDIAGNNIDNIYANFALTQKVQELDVVINEILFNPRTDESDFIEIYNRGNVPINLKSLLLANRDDYGELKSVKKITEQGAVLLPKSYMVLTENNESIKKNYTIEDEFAFYQLTDMPSMPNGNGSIVLLDTTAQVIDEFSYCESMHFSLLTSDKGVSLERISSEKPTQDENNWHSASELAGWATPGYKNSVYKEYGNFSENIFVDPEVFSPDNDGFNDFATISYKFNEPGNMARVIVFDKQGRQIRELVSNELLGIEGYWIWDGLTDSKQKAPAGIYVVVFEIFNLDGQTNRYKKVCTINTRF